MFVPGLLPQMNHKITGVTGFTMEVKHGRSGMCNSDHESPPLLVTSSCGFRTLSCVNSQAVCAFTLLTYGQPMSSGCIVLGVQVWPAFVERITTGMVACCSTAQTAPLTMAMLVTVRCSSRQVWPPSWVE